MRPNEKCWITGKRKDNNADKVPPLQVSAVRPAAEYEYIDISVV